MKTETGELLTRNQEHLNYREIAEIESQLNIGDYLLANNGWRERVTSICYLTTHNCISITMSDGEKTSWTRLKQALKNGSCKIVHCFQPQVPTCPDCSLSNYGADCNNNPIRQ